MYSLRGGVPGGAKSTTACITSLRPLQAKIILADFNLLVSTQTAKPPNLIPRQIFQLYGRPKKCYFVDCFSPGDKVG